MIVPVIFNLLMVGSFVLATLVARKFQRNWLGICVGTGLGYGLHEMIGFAAYLLPWGQLEFWLSAKIRTIAMSLGL